MQQAGQGVRPFRARPRSAGAVLAVAFTDICAEPLRSKKIRL